MRYGPKWTYKLYIMHLNVDRKDQGRVLDVQNLFWTGTPSKTVQNLFWTGFGQFWTVKTVQNCPKPSITWEILSKTIYPWET